MSVRDLDTVRATLKEGYPAYWRAIRFGPSGWALTAEPLQVIYSWADYPERPGVDWLHASISHMHRMPSYEELQLLFRAVFTGWAYEVFAPPEHHVNIHENARHLWGRLDGRPVMPNFGATGTI